MFEAHWDEDPVVVYFFERCGKKLAGCRFHILNLKDIKWSEVSMNGYIEFDGYFYIEEKEYASNPYIMFIHSKELISPIIYHRYGIIFEKKELIKDTSFPEGFSNDDPEENICFFPTEHQRLVFKIVEIFPDKMTDEDAKEVMCKYAEEKPMMAEG